MMVNNLNFHEKEIWEKIIETDKYQKIRDLANKFDRKLYEEYQQEKLKDLNQEEQNYPISQTR